MAKKIFPPKPVERVHFHLTDGKNTVAWSWSEERARARAVMNNMVAHKAGSSTRFRVYPCRVQDCFVLHGKE